MSAVSAAQAALDPSYIIDGREIGTPVLVNRAVSSTAIFLVSASKARRYIPRRDLAPAELLPGRAGFCLKCTHYIDGDLGPHSEISMEFLVRRNGRKSRRNDTSKPRPLGDTLAFLRSALPSYVHRRFVSDGFPAKAAREIWGIDAVVGQVSAETVGTRYQGKLVLDGQHVLTFSVPFGGKRVIPENEQFLYTHIGGQLCEIATASASEKVGIHLGGARVTLGNHALSGELGNLGLPKRAFASVWRGLVRRRVEAPYPV